MPQAEKWTISGWKIIFDHTFKPVTDEEFEDLEIFLFENDNTPTVNSIDADFDEIVGSGLDVQDLGSATWDVATDDGSTIVYSRYNGITGLVYTITGTQDVYGYAIRGKTSSTIYYAKNFGLRPMVATNTLTIQPLSMRVDLG